MTKMSMIFLLLPALLGAQNYLDALRPFYGFQSVQPLNIAIGNSTVAAGQVIPGFTNNPASWGMHRFTSLQTGFNLSNFESGSKNLTGSGFSGVGFTLPVQVYRGSLSFGGGIFQDLDFSTRYGNSQYTYNEEGGMYKTVFGFSVEYSENFFVGADIQYYRGGDEMIRFYDSDSTDYLDMDYKGWSASLGAIHRVSPMVQIGAAIQLPTAIWADETFTFSNHLDPDDYAIWNSDYKLTRPMQVFFGASFLHPIINIFYQGDWTDWTNLKFEGDNIFVDNQPLDVIIDEEIRENMQTTLSHHLGFAFHIPQMPLHFYGGYQYLEIPYKSFYESDMRESVSAGISYLISQQVSLQFGQTRYFWDYLGEEETYTQTAFGLTLHY